MKKLISIVTLLATTAPVSYALADGSEQASATPVSAKATAGKTKSTKVKSLSDEAAKAIAADAALTDFSPEPLLSSDRRIKTLMYDEADVYTITTKYGYQTNIVFSRGESIETISVGDRSMWQIIPSGNRMFIRPMEENVITNMTILTNRHSYQFDLKSIGADKEGNNIYVAKFEYPDEKSSTNSMPQPIMHSTGPAPTPVAYVPPTPTQPAIVNTPPVTGTTGPGITQPVHPNYNYTYTGPDELAPLQVYDDGKSTFVKYRTPHPPFPKLYAVDANGTETPVTYEIVSDMMVFDTVTGELLLKSPQGTVHVYNELLNPR